MPLSATSTKPADNAHSKAVSGQEKSECEMKAAINR